MKRITGSVLVVMASLALAGCGADGEPTQPTASLGVGVSTSGVNAGASLGVRKGPWAISWGRYL